ncbi:MAG: penicillin-binding protein [Mucilaginibacter sp.]|nr:penicillin-binding protein [Mucilaginibacter sp.]
MAKISYLISFVFFLLLSNYVLSQTNDKAGKQIDSLFAKYNSQTPGVAVAIIKDGQIIFKKGYGMANLENDIPITPQTVFHIASVSKQFTAFAIYLLESQGKISLDDDVRKYIPELPDYGTPIKIRHLLAHTSGLRDQWAILTLAGWRMDDVITTEQILKVVTKQKNTNFKPGSAFSYSNTGYTLLAEIVRRITGKTFAEYTSENIFKPLGMTSTQFYDDHQRIVKRRADSYEMVNNSYYNKRLNFATVGATGLMTTVEDLSKWVLNFEKPIIGNSKLIREFNQPSYLDNGKKIVFSIINGDTLFHAKAQLLRNYRGINVIKHGGHDAGFRAFLARFPDQHFSIITLSNDEHYEIFKSGLEIAGFYLKDALQEKKESSVIPENKSAKTNVNYSLNSKGFEGEYYNDELATNYHFKTLGNKLIMCHSRLSDVELSQTGENKFSGSGEQIFSFEMEFLKNEKKEVIGFVISNFGAKNIKFVKVA